VAQEWHLFLFDLGADRSETTSVWDAQPGVGAGMFARFQAWQATVLHSQVVESLCAANATSRGVWVNGERVAGRTRLGRHAAGAQ
jgi:sulfur relay (sulfurtransferase) complex TusBCD TusD component (DsrE family)